MHGRHRLIAIALGVCAASGIVAAKDKKPKVTATDPQDEIEIVAHVTVTGGPVRRFVITQHYSSNYLYVEHEDGKNLTLIDVTKAAKPAVLTNVASAPEGASGSLYAVAGTAAVVPESQITAPLAPRAIRIMDFSDPQHPKVAREFTGVTAIDRDDRRGLIFVANGEGVWILHQNFADDPEVQKAYAHHVLYDH